MKTPLFLIATAILGTSQVYGQCPGGYCPIQNLYHNSNAPSHYGYSHPDGNQNPGWQGNQTPDYRNDNGWRGDSSYQGRYNNNYYYRSNDNDNTSYEDTNNAMRNPSASNMQGYYYSSPNANNPVSNTGNQTPAPVNQNVGPDSLVQHRADEALKNNYLKKNYDSVNVRVYNGTATLSGTVESEEDRQDAENRIRAIPGINNVNDQLKVNPSAGTNKEVKNSAQSDDGDLQKKVDDALKNNYVKKNFDGVKAEVSNGVVILKGTVENDRDLAEIRERLKKIDGVKTVNDDQVKISGEKTSYNSGRRSYSGTL